MSRAISSRIFILLYLQATVRNLCHCMGGGQHLEQPNVERPILQNFEYSKNER